MCHSGHTAVLLGGCIYVGGGIVGRNTEYYQDSYRIDVYNLTTIRWSSFPITAQYRNFAMTILDNKLIIVGGVSKNNEVVRKILFLNAGRWKNYSEMPTARFCATAVGYHSMLIVVGGTIMVKGKWSITSMVELLDTTNGCWYTCNSLPSPHRQLKAAIMNGKLYLLGGVNEDVKLSPLMFVASLDTLSTHQLNWQSLPNTPWQASAPVVVYHKFLLTVGGRDESRTSEVNIFNPLTGQWKRVTNIPASRSGTAVVGLSEEILVIGGSTNKNTEISNTVWIGVFK